MEGNVKIQKITEEKLDEFFDFFSRLMLTQFPEYSQASINSMLTNSRAYTKERIKKDIKRDSVWFGAYLNNKTVGFIYGERQWGGISEVHWLAVDPLFQRKGIGRALVFRFEKIAKDQGAHSVHLRSDPRNINFYKKLGYEVIGFDNKSYFGAPDYILRKLIQEPKDENFLR